MPELPEVQTVVNQLNEKIVGKTIVDFRSDWKKNIFPSYRSFMKLVSGAKVSFVRRLGKHIVIDLATGHSIVIHLKMTGHLLYKTDENRRTKAFMEDRINGYIRHILTFDDGATLEFSDMRKFGWLRILPTGKEGSFPGIGQLGLDALSPELTPERLRELFRKKATRPIGAVLLEQNLIAGIGNIYRSEALFLTGLLPMRRVRDIRTTEWQKIVPAIRKVLRQAVRLGGTSDGDFRDTDGLPGQFQRTLHVYGREHLPCKKCGTMIQRKKIVGRSVFYCSRCQR